MLEFFEAQHTNSRRAKDVGDDECLARHHVPAWGTPGSVVANDRDMQHSLLFPMARFACYWRSLPPRRTLRLCRWFKGPRPTKTFFNGDREDPVAVASEVGGATMVFSRDF